MVSLACACRAQCEVLGQCSSVERAQLGRYTECSSWTLDEQGGPHRTLAVDSHLSEPWPALAQLEPLTPVRGQLENWMS